MMLRFQSRYAARRAARSDSPRASAFTLLEIILALAILAGSLAALGEVMRLADQNAAYARDISEAEILASSIMDEVLSGARQPTQTVKQPFDYATEQPWVFSVLIESTNFNEVLRVGVKVELNIESNKEPASYEVYRWVINPQYATQLAEQEAAIAEQAAQQAAQNAQAASTASTASTGGGTGSAGGGATGGGATGGGTGGTGGGSTGGGGGQGGGSNQGGGGRTQGGATGGQSGRTGR